MNADKALELARLAYPNDENLRVAYMLGLTAGANWTKSKTIEVIDYKIVNNLAAYPVIYYEVNHLGLKYGDKVKIIIIKEEE